MEIWSSLFSLMFFVVSIISIYWGFYIIKLNPKEKINRSFLFVCISLSIWAFSFSFGNVARNTDVALFWRRVAAVGWTSIVSISLHFLLLITRKIKDKKQEWIIYLLHIPALINMYIFSFSNKISIGQYDLISNSYGWINQTVNNGWDYLYYIYYIVYMTLGLVLVWKWKEKLNDKMKVKQSNMIFWSLLAALVVGSLTDLKVDEFFKIDLPQMAPLFMLLPVWAMYHAVRFYDLIQYENAYKADIIVTEDDKKKIFYITSVVLCVGGVLSFIFDYSKFIKGGSNSLNAAILKSLGFIVSGFVLYHIQKIKKETLRETLTRIILLVNIPIITLYFLENASITVWVFPVIIIITSLIFSNKTLLISTTIIAVITQRVVWILKPRQFVIVDKYDYILRIILFLLIFIIGYYVNRSYVSKIKAIKENNYQIKFQKMVLDISFDFLGLNQENFDEKIDNMLEEIGDFFCVDRTYLFTINHSKNTMTYANEWCSEGIDSEIQAIEDVSLDTFPWWLDQLDKDKIVYIEDVDDMVEEAKWERKELQRQKVKSLVAVPMFVEGKVEAFIGIDSVSETKTWSDEDIKSLRIVSNVLASGLLQVKADKAIEFMAYYDSLTELPNRILFAERVRQEIEFSEEKGDSVAVIFIDLDGFKSVNDTIGHKGGDILLKEVANSLKKILRKGDTLARFGGDEFMILLSSIKENEMIFEVADKVMELFSGILKVRDQEFLMTASAGISVYPVDGRDPETLIKNADLAMYKAKLKGKNQYTLCTSDMKDEMQVDIEISNDLYHALEKDELVVYYQPQVDLKTNKITGLEALVRWNHPTRGVISPGVFIPIAEKNSLINSIGKWVLKTACRQNKKWQDMGFSHMDIAINLSAIQVINPKISCEIESIIEQTGLDPKYIELEITESIAIKEINYVIGVLNKLKRIGLSIAIDDFGTEYSSLSRLKMLPIDRLKIDMQFVKGLESNEKDKAIIKVIIDLAKNLGLNVIAEGVETKGQRDFLNENMCDSVQGYFYYKPMPAEEIEKILIESNK